jgi:UDP-glucose 4-epimerase
VHHYYRSEKRLSRRYLVTGGSGFIGAALVKRLIHDGHSVRIIDNNSRGSAANLADVINDVDFVQTDIRDSAAVTQAAENIDSVVHLAAVNGTEFFYDRPELILDVGIRGMLNVIDACRDQDVDDLVIASSSEVYQTPETIPTGEDAVLSIPDVLNPRYSYAGSKIISELIAINYGRTSPKRVSIFRPHNVYGPSMGWEHVLPQFILRAVDAIDNTPTGPIPFPIQGDGSQTRAFIHIDDFINALMIVLSKGEHLGIYHIGNPEEISMRHAAEKVVGYFGRGVDIIPGESPAGGTARRCPDISKIKALGFEPQISFDQGLPSIADWYAANADRRPDRITK